MWSESSEPSAMMILPMFALASWVTMRVETNGWTTAGIGDQSFTC